MGDNFLVLYNKVFDDKGEVKLCGRLACINLILCADEIEPKVYHGNISTGFMNVEAIKKLKKSISKKVR